MSAGLNTQLPAANDLSCRGTGDNRERLLSSNTASSLDTEGGQSDFVTYHYRRRNKRKRQEARDRVAELRGLQAGGLSRPQDKPQQNQQQRDQSRKEGQGRNLLVGKCARSDALVAANGPRKKVVLCVDNLHPDTTLADVATFLKANFGIEPLTLFPTQTRRRRRDQEGEEPERAAFRLCVYQDTLRLLLQENIWPADVTISEWFFKSAKTTDTTSDRQRGGGRKDYVLGDVIGDKLQQLRQEARLQNEDNSQQESQFVNNSSIPGAMRGDVQADRASMVSMVTSMADQAQMDYQFLSALPSDTDWGGEMNGVEPISEDVTVATAPTVNLVNQSSSGDAAHVQVGGGASMFPRAASSPDESTNDIASLHHSSVSLRIQAHTQTIDISCNADTTIVASAADDHDFGVASDINLSNNFSCLKDGVTE
jgi:hypothetical protein